MRELEDIKWPFLEIPSHREAVGRIIRSRSSEAVNGKAVRKRWVNVNMHNFFSWKPMVAILLIVIVVSSLTACLLIFASGSGEAGNEMKKDELRAKALAEAKEIIPEAETLEEASWLDGSLETAFTLKDKDGKMVGMITVDRSTGEIEWMLDAREDSSKKSLSTDVKISLDEATAIAENFLKEKGVNLEDYALEGEPLVRCAMVGPPDNPVPAYLYEFNYRIQVDGLFVDDYLNGGVGCVVRLSPEDGSVLGYIVPENYLHYDDLEREEMNTEKAEAMEIAIGKAKEELDKNDANKNKVPVIKDDEVELRYMVDKNNKLVPYWKVKVNYRDTSIDTSIVPDAASYIGGAEFGVSAVDGSILWEGSYW